ncbi:MFS transporter [Tardiphaga sp. 172_B4_N1_3]|uniref:MFS transporter n=1 Tax=Tardiphaga sp. 172_B4_N1_3 TaxID=3240787 RepID=UPI003F89A7B4
MSVFWLAVAAFAIGTEAFVIAGLLPIMAADLNVTLAATGQLVTVYAITYAIGSPILAVLFSNFDRRTVVSLALVCFIVGNLLAAVATTFGILLLSRMLMAVGAGLCMPTAMAVAIAIAAPERRGRAASLVISGLTVATVLGVPLGTWVGSHFGWRSTFVMVAALGAVALAGLLLGLPRGLPRTAATLGQRLAVARHSEVLKTLAVTCMWGLGGFTSFTYLAVPLHRLGFDANGISLALLVFGVAAAIGNTLGGAMSDRIGPLRTSTLGLIGMMLSLTLQSVALTFAPPATAGVLFLVFIFTQGIAGWMFYPGQVAHLVRITPEASVIALSLNASAMYIGFAGGSALGGVVLSTLSSNHLGWIGGCAEAAAFALVLAGHLLKRPKPAQIAG